MADLIIRPAKKEDYPGIHTLLQQIAVLHHELRPDLFIANPKLSKKDYRKRLRTAKGNPVLVAVLDQRIVGHMFAEVKRVRKNPVQRKRDIFYVDDLCVDETCRAHGIGRRLMEAAEQLALLHQCGHLELNVYQCNEGAIKFYERLGFAPQRLTLERTLGKL